VKLAPLHVTLALVVMAVLVTLLPPRNARVAAAASGVKVGLVFDVGGRGDKSFNDAAYRGLLRAQKELGADVNFLEPAASEDRAAALRDFAAAGYDLVIAVGFVFSSDVDAVAKAFPAVHFACVDYAPPRGGPPLPNVLGLVFREEEGSFLVGAAAGLLSKSHTVGFVGGMFTPLIQRFEIGYAAGVHATCPACRVLAGYIGATPDAFKDPAKGKAIATSQAASGADVLYHAAGASGHGVFEGAKDQGVLAIGVDTDQHDELPGTVVTSMVKRMDVAVFEAIKDASLGRFEAKLAVFGLKEDGVDWVHEGPHAAGIPDEVRERVEQLRREVIEGTRAVPRE